MKKLTMILMAMLLSTASVWARPALSKPVDVKQPDGTVITLRLRGDEFLSFTTTVDGYTVVKGEDGFYRYAEKGADGQLKATEVIARNPEARTAQDLSFLADRKKMVAPKMSESQCQRKEMAAQMYAPAYGKSAASHRSPTSIWKRINYDNFKGLVVLVEYSDFKFKTENPREFYQKLTSEKNYTDNSKTNYPVNVEGSARDYFYDNSMGIFDPSFDVVGPVQLDMKATDVGGRDVTNETQVKMFKSALNKLNADVDFSQYDLDSDGYIDMVYFIFAGYGSYVQGNDPGYLWPHANNWTGYSSWVGMPKYDGKLFGRYACSVEIQDYESQKAQHQYLDGIGTICHEFSHVLGLADHYDADYEENGQSNDPGAYDVMAGGADFNYGLTPVGYNAFERHVLGFTEPTVLTEAGTYELQPFATGNQAYILKTGSTDDDFYLENRQKTGWDRFLPGHGLLVWRADTSTPNVWKNNKVNTDANHNYFVMVTTAPNNGKLVDLTSTTDPALVSWAGQPATLDLYDITEEGGVVTFTASKEAYQSVIEDFEQSPVSESGATGVKGVYCTWDLNNASIEQVDGSNVVKLLRSGTLTSSVFENGVRSLAFTVKNGTEAVKVGLKVSTDGGSFAYLKNTDGKTQVDIKKNEEASLSYRDIPANSKIQITMLSTKASAYCYLDNIVATFYDNEIPTPTTEINPIEDENVDFGSNIDDNTNLDGNTDGDIYYCIGSGDGNYDSTEGCIVITTPTDDSVVNTQDIFSDDFKEKFTGIVFRVPTGKGNIKVEAQTTGNMVLSVKIGTNDPIKMELEGKLKASIPYDVLDPTYVYIYGSSNTASSPNRAISATDGELKIYGLEVYSGTNAIINIENPLISNNHYYSLDGRELLIKPTQKGLYIVNGKKVVVK